MEAVPLPFEFMNMFFVWQRGFVSIRKTSCKCSIWCTSLGNCASLS